MKKEKNLNFQDYKKRGIIYKCPNGVCGWEAKNLNEVEWDDNGTAFCPICHKEMIEVEG